MYNKTQLSPQQTFERHVFHRDQFAHFIRWTHVLKIAKIGMKILDFGSGSGSLAEVLYRNRYKADKYLGLDIRKRTVKIANEKFEKVDWINFEEVDLCGQLNMPNDWDIITCFEVIEHIGKSNGNKLLQNIVSCMNDKTVLLLSTPNFDEKVGAANNHIIEGQISEYEFNELKDLLTKYFVIENVWGTFASQKDYKNLISEELKDLFDKAHAYYDSNLLSNFMAPLIKPEHARNCLWSLRRKTI